VINGQTHLSEIKERIGGVALGFDGYSKKAA
jgi:hypothetical protein